MYHAVVIVTAKEHSEKYPKNQNLFALGPSPFLLCSLSVVHFIVVGNITMDTLSESELVRPKGCSQELKPSPSKALPSFASMRPNPSCKVQYDSTLVPN